MSHEIFKLIFKFCLIKDICSGILGIVYKTAYVLAELQRSCSRLKFWRKVGVRAGGRTDGRAGVWISSLTR